MSGTSDRVPPELTQVLAGIDGQEVVDLAQRLVRVPGQNPPGEEAATVAVLEEECRVRGLDLEISEVAPGRPNLVVRLAGERIEDGPGLLVLGHTDVVPAGEEEEWAGDPFSGAVRDGRLYGRGSADMKGGLAAVVVALGALRRASVPLTGPVTLAALVDEEELGLGIRDYVRSFDPRSFRACLVAEPTSLRPIVAARGDAYLQVDIAGVAAHSGNPADGRNAINGAARVITELEAWHEELSADPHPLVGPATWSVGTVEGGQSTSAVPAYARISADRRLLPRESAEAVLTEVRERLATLSLHERGLQIEVTMTMAMPGFETPLDDPFVGRCQEALRLAGLEAEGLPMLEPGGWTAACDGGFVAERTAGPVVVLGPGSVSEAAHRPNESVRISELAVAARAYAAVIGGPI